MLQAYDIWSTVAGVVGMISSIPLIYAIICSQLPSTKLGKLEAALRDTEALLRSIIEEGLLAESSQAPHFELYLSSLRASADQYRDEVYMATTFGKEVKGWLTGLSREISVVYKEVLKLRARICETSAEARERQSGKGEPRRRRDCFSWYQRIWAALKRSVRRRRAIVEAPQAGDACSEDASSVALSTMDACHAVSPAPATASNSILVAEPSPKSSHAVTKSKGNLLAHSRKARVRALMRVIRQADQELTLLGVRHPALSEVMQDGGRRAIHLPGRTADTHRTKKSPSLVSALTATQHVVVLDKPEAQEDDSSDEDCAGVGAQSVERLGAA